jgi:hypothetical protein
MVLREGKRKKEKNTKLRLVNGISYFFTSLNPGAARGGVGYVRWTMHGSRAIARATCNVKHGTHTTHTKCSVYATVVRWSLPARSVPLFSFFFPERIYYLQ